MTAITGNNLVTSVGSNNVMLTDPVTSNIKEITLANFQNGLANPYSEDLTSVTTSTTTETTFRNYIISSNRMYAFNAGGQWSPSASNATTCTLRFYFNGNLIFTLTNNALVGAVTQGWKIRISVQKISNTEAGVYLEGSVNGTSAAGTQRTMFSDYKYVTGVNFSGIAFVLTGQVNQSTSSMTIYTSNALAYP